MFAARPCNKEVGSRVTVQIGSRRGRTDIGTETVSAFASSVSYRASHNRNE